MVGVQLFFNGHAGAGLGLFLLIFAIIGLVLFAGLLFLVWRFRSVAGLKYAGGFFVLSALSQLVLSFSPTGLFPQAFAALFGLPWYHGFETILGESDGSNFAFSVKVGAVINTILIFLVVGLFKRINRRELSLR